MLKLKDTGIILIGFFIKVGKKDLASFGLVFLFFFTAFSLIYLPNRGIISIDDHFFHFKLAEKIRDGGISYLKNFSGIYLDSGVEKGIGYFPSLYNIALIPFTFFKDDILGLKISDVFWASLSSALIFLSLKKIGIKKPFFWSLFLASLDFFVMRSLLGRAFVLSAPFMFFEAYFAVNKKWKSFFAISLFHVFWHQSTFFLPLLAAIVVEMGRYLVERRFYWKNMAGSIVAAGLTMAYFPRLAKNLLIAQSSAIDTNNSVNIEGMELLKHDIFNIFRSSEILFVFLLFGLVSAIFVYMRSKNRENYFDKTEAKNDAIFLYVFFMFSIIFLTGSINISGRFYDFYIPSAVLALAVALKILFGNGIISIKKPFPKYILSLVIIFLLFAVTDNLLNRKKAIENVDYRTTGMAAQWIRDKSEQNQKVFLQSWNYFPVAFFHNSKDYYTVGIEPMGLYNYNKELYWKWYNIYVNAYYCDFEGDCAEEKNKLNEKLKDLNEEERMALNKENSQKIINSIKNDFKAKYIICSKPFADLIGLNPELVSSSSNFNSEYIDGDSTSAIELY